jgi:hypothetical protein
LAGCPGSDTTMSAVVEITYGTSERRHRVCMRMRAGQKTKKKKSSRVVPSWEAFSRSACPPTDQSSSVHTFTVHQPFTNVQRSPAIATSIPSPFTFEVRLLFPYNGPEAARLIPPTTCKHRRSKKKLVSSRLLNRPSLAPSINSCCPFTTQVLQDIINISTPQATLHSSVQCADIDCASTVPALTTTTRQPPQTPPLATTTATAVMAPTAAATAVVGAAATAAVTAMATLSRCSYIFYNVTLLVSETNKSDFLPFRSLRDGKRLGQKLFLYWFG